MQPLGARVWLSWGISFTYSIVRRWSHILLFAVDEWTGLLLTWILRWATSRHKYEVCFCKATEMVVSFLCRQDP